MWCSSPCLVLLGLALAPVVLASEELAQHLEPGNRIEREIKPQEKHLYEISGPAGSPLLITVEQRDVDLVLELRQPSGEGAEKLDAPTSRQGPESVLIPRAEAGAYRLGLEAQPGTGAPGHYEIRVEDLSGADPDRIEAERRTAEASKGFAKSTAEGRREAVALYEGALPLWRKLKERRREAWTLTALGGLHLFLGEAREALASFKEAVPLWDSLGEPGRQADGLTGIGLTSLNLGDRVAALEAFQKALALQQAQGDRYGEARTRNNVCLIRQQRGELREALACYGEVLAVYRALGEPDREANTLLNLAGVQESLGEPDAARENYTQVLSFARAIKDRRREAQALHNLAVLDAVTGQQGEALVRYGQALAIFRELGELSWEAKTLQNLGSCYLDLGEPERSLVHQQEALDALRKLGDRFQQARALNALGRTWRVLGDLAKAEAAHEEALTLAKAVGARREQALALLFLGQERALANDLPRGLALVEESASLLESLGDRRMRASALREAAVLHQRSGRGEPARALLEEALGLSREVRDPRLEVEILTATAGLERSRGHLREALAILERARDLAESLRATVAPPDLRAAFFSTQRKAFDLSIGILMDLHGREPDQGHARQALEISERARARAFLDLLGEAAQDIRQGDPALQERRGSLLRRLAAKASARERSSASAPDAAREEEDLLLQLDQTEAALRAGNPRYSALTRPRALRAGEIQALLDGDTLLLEYFLGEEKSYVWAVSPASVAGFELPPRAVIEAAARDLYEALRSPAGSARNAPGGVAERLRTLSRMLLQPVAGLLGSRRLAIVADGALEYIPFSALLLPRAGSSSSREALLLEDHEIVLLPSASTLAVQRAETRAHPSTSQTVAVFADPVFARNDPRLASLSAASRGSGTPDLDQQEFPRLPASRLEAEAIGSLLPERTSLALGFDASRDKVLTADLTRFPIVHFATHGRIDSRVPGLSGLMLSRIDPQGRPQEGFLSLADIYNLHLAADLVVLSGCETALGREIRGEGLIGLTRAFLYAGAERVVASLWNVRDRATAELMKSFYRLMLRDRLPPSAALRQAQLSLRRDHRWRDPFYWAPFVIQGDWR